MFAHIIQICRCGNHFIVLTFNSETKIDGGLKLKDKWENRYYPINLDQKYKS